MTFLWTDSNQSTVHDATFFFVVTKCKMIASISWSYSLILSISKYIFWIICKWINNIIGKETHRTTSPWHSNYQIFVDHFQSLLRQLYRVTINECVQFYLFLLINTSLPCSILKVACVCAQLCPILCDPMDCSPQGSSVHGIFQARILECVAISSSRGSSQPRDQTHISCVSCIGRQIIYHWATGEAIFKVYLLLDEIGVPQFTSPFGLLLVFHD